MIYCLFAYTVLSDAKVDNGTVVLAIIVLSGALLVAIFKQIYPLLGIATADRDRHTE